MAERSGQTVEQIAKDTDRDRFMSAEEAVEYGLIDKMLTNRA
jgi:ATP-dependent Clp protease protease subunit